MIPEILDYCVKITQHFEEIPSDRKDILTRIANHIAVTIEQQKPVHLIYICTHNSRRSHFGQVWAQVAAHYFQIPHVYTYSGGTEATAFNANARQALRRIGFEIASDGEEPNPRFTVHFDETQEPILCFSKVYSHASNPQRDFVAILTCSEADENCPLILGADVRISTPYEDPKAFDGSALQEEKYDERCRQIALETFYIFNQLNPNL